jgi:hypothetical protein
MVYNDTNHTMLNFVLGSMPFTPNAITKYPIANKKRPIACLKGEAGSMFFLPIHPHNHTNKGAKITIATALMLWK